MYSVTDIASWLFWSLRLIDTLTLYSALFAVPHIQGAQVWITQFYLQITPYLPLPRKRSPDGATTDLWWRPSNYSLLLICWLRKDEKLSWPSWLNYSGRFTHIIDHPSAVSRLQQTAGKFAGQRPTFYHCATQPLTFTYLLTYLLTPKTNYGIYYRGERHALQIKFQFWYFLVETVED